MIHEKRTKSIKGHEAHSKKKKGDGRQEHLVTPKNENTKVCSATIEVEKRKNGGEKNETFGG